MSNLICKCCGKKATELTEYVELAEECGYDSVDECVANEEGTYNKETGLFWCTSCYIKLGMPLGTA